MSWPSTICNILKRKKVIDPETVDTETRLARVLSTLDLTALGVGSTLGVGVYVLAGHVARDSAGPAVILSFILAGIASIFAGLCYAEFGARAPRAGSAYVYSYVTVGEFVAFVIGWNLILEYVIGAASVARGLSLYLDKALNDTMKDWYIEVIPIHNINFLAEYFDLMAFVVPILLSLALAFGMKQSSNVNKACTAVNLFIVAFVVIAGGINADFKNWDLPVPDNVTTNSTIHYGKGGFFPFGLDGVIKGAATCFYGFVGFDCIATTGEEVKNPIKAIPRSIFWSLLVIMLAYVGTSAIITLMVPYYLQDANAPIPHAFKEIGWIIPMWIVSIGGMFGLAASLFGAMFPLPRILYAMASDGLIFKFLGAVNDRFSAPVIGTIISGVLTGLLAALFDLTQLVNMMSIGTLLAYTIVAACVLLLRYSGPAEYSLVRTSSDSDLYSTTGHDTDGLITNTEDESAELSQSQQEKLTFYKFLPQIFNLKKQRAPTRVSEMLVVIEIFLFCLLSLGISLMYMWMTPAIKDGEIWAIVLVSCTGLLMILILMSMATQPTALRTDIFQVPWVPLFPALSILVNIYLMVMLDINTWIRFGVWMAIGLPMYLFSICRSKNTKKSSKLAVPNGISLVNGDLVANGKVNYAYVDDELPEDANLRGTQADELLGEADYGDKRDDSILSKVDIVLAELDDTLSKEDNRKISIDTVSTMSNACVEENVIALVHCEDVSNPATPSNEPPTPFPIIPEEATVLENNYNDDNKDVRVSESTNVKNSNLLDAIENEVDNLLTTSIPPPPIAITSIPLPPTPPATPTPPSTPIPAAPTLTLTIPPPPPLPPTLLTTPLIENMKSLLSESKKDFEETGRPDEINEPYMGDAKLNAINNHVIPIPPPMDGFETFSTTIDNKLVTLRKPKSPTTPLPLQSASNIEEDDIDGDENVMAGTDRYDNIKSKLNRILSMKAPTKLTRPPKVETDTISEQTSSHVPILEELKAKHISFKEDLSPNEEINSTDNFENIESSNNDTTDGDPKEEHPNSNIVDTKEHLESKETDTVEEVQKPKDIRKALEALYSTQPRPKPTVSKYPNIKSLDRNFSKGKGDSPEVLNGINKPTHALLSDLNNDSKSSSIRRESSGVKHKALMANTLASIRLRKVDSFKLT